MKVVPTQNNKSDNQPLETKKNSNWLKEIGKTIFDIVKYAAITAVVCLLLTNFVILNSIIASQSMVPTLPVQSIMFCSRIDYYIGSPERGDIVVFDHESSEYPYTKRVVGMPGDTVEIVEGVTYVNGEILHEPYLAEAPDKLSFGPFEVPDNEYFLLGDNRNDSKDARVWDYPYVKEDDILAKGYFLFNHDKATFEQIYDINYSEKEGD